MIRILQKYLTDFSLALKIATSLLAINLSFASAAEIQALEKSKIEAAFIYNFLKYTNWPTAKPAGQPLRIVVLNEAELFENLSKLTQGKLIDGHPIEVLQEQRNWKEVDAVYIGQEKQLDKGISNEIKLQPILIISQFGNPVAMIRFYQEDQKIRFEIDSSLVEDGKLTLSSQLLKLARVVP
jgi:hypothetical protein